MVCVASLRSAACCDSPALPVAAISARASISSASASASAAAPQAALRHRAIEPALGREQARRVDEHDLRVALDDDAADRRARRLRLARDDRDFGADQRVEQRRFARIRRADQGDEAASRFAHDVAHRLRKACAAACSAARLEAASPRSGSKPSSSTCMTNCGAMRGPAARDLDIARRRKRAPLRPFLHRRLGVALGLGSASIRARQARATSSRAASKPASRNTAPISASQTSREDRRLLAPAAARLAQPHHDMRPDVPFLRDRRAGLAPHQLGEPHRQFALGRLRIGLVEHFGDDDAEHAVAEELEPLIGMPAPARARRRRGDMGQRARQQGRVSANVWPSRASSAARSAFGRWSCRAIGKRPRRREARAQWTRWNSRFQRTVHGQRQNCQAAAPSSTEKKMISARPIRFSAGT